jgi:hypothetical protein
MGNFLVVPLLISVGDIKMALKGLDADGSDRTRRRAVVETVTKLWVCMSNFGIV